MSQQPGSGSGPYGPQGQNPYGQQPGQNPPQNPYGQQPPQNPYGQQPPYGQPPQNPQPNPYGQQPPQAPYGSSPTPAPQTPAYGQQPGQTPLQPYSPAPPPSYPTPGQQPTPGYGTSAPSAPPAPGTPRYGAPPTLPPTPAYGASPTAPPTPAYGSGTPSPYGSPTPPSSFSGAPTPPPTPQAYGPGQPAQGWSGDARAPQAYSPVPGAFPPAPPKKKSRAGLVIGVVAAVLVLLVGGGYLVSQALKKPDAVAPIATPTAPISKATTANASASASATSSASGYPGFTQSGSTLTGSNFTTTLPTGWTLSAKNGGKNEGEIIDQDNNLIDYFSDYQRNATENCAYQAASIASASGVETAQPPVAVNGVVWAGDPATGVEVTLKRATQTQQEVVGYYCVDHAGVSVLVRSISWASNTASVQTGAKQLLASWKWQ
jgi:hypothetical protein